MDAERLRSFFVVGRAELRPHHAVVAQRHLLTVFAHPPRLIVVYDDDDRQVVAHRRIELREVQAHGAVARQHQDSLLRVSQLRSQPERDAGPEATQVTMTQVTSRPPG